MRALAAWPLLGMLLAAGCVAPAPDEEEEPGTPTAPAPEPPRRGPLAPRTPAPRLPSLEGLGGTGAEAGGDGPTSPAEEPPASTTPPPPTPTTPAPISPAGPSPEPTPAPSPSSSAPPAGSPSPPPPVAPPVRFVAGPDARPSAFVPRFEVSDGGGSFSATLRGVPDARVHAASLVLLENAGDSTRTVRLAAEKVASPRVLEARFTFLLDGSPAGTLDLLADAPSVELALPPGASLVGAWTLALREDAGAADGFARTIRLDAA